MKIGKIYREESATVSRQRLQKLQNLRNREESETVSPQRLQKLQNLRNREPQSQDAKRHLRNALR